MFAAPPPRIPLRPPLGWLLAAASLCATAAAVSCSASDAPLGEPAEAILPASSAARAEARKEREARSKAKGEQKPDAPRASASARPAKPPPKASAAPSATPSAELDAGAPADAGPASSASAQSSASASAGTPSQCRPLCARLISCMMDSLAAKVSDPTTADRIRSGGEAARQSCTDECTKKENDQSQSFRDAANACAALSDCDAFTSCMRELQRR